MNKRKLKTDKENKSIAFNKRKSFKDLVKKGPQENKQAIQKDIDENDHLILDFKENLLKSKNSNVIKKDDSEEAKIPPQDHSISESRFFNEVTAAYSDNLINDFSIKSYVKINCSTPMNWINDISMSQSEDNRYKRALEECLNYYTYPATDFDDTYLLSNTQLSRNSSGVVDISKLDKQWLLSFKDCYQKYLMHDDLDKQLEFSLLTNEYKVVFIAKPEIVNNELVMKRFAIVGRPSKRLVEILAKQEVLFEKFTEPTIDQSMESDNLVKNGSDDQDSDSIHDELNRYACTQEAIELSANSQEYIDINLYKDNDPLALLVEGVNIHGLMLALLSLCKPYQK